MSIIPGSRIESILALLENVKPAGDGKYSTSCPAHEDRSPSLSISTGDDGRVLLHCFAGCSNANILKAIGKTMRDLMPSDGQPHRNGKPKKSTSGKTYPTWQAALKALENHLGSRTAYWLYHDAEGNVVAAVGRWDKDGEKTFRPVSRHGDAWKIGDPSGPWPMYGLPEILGKKDSAFVILEGEKCVDAAGAIELPAATSAHGAKSPRKTDWSALADREVVILPDNDPAGESYAKTVTSILLQLNPPARVKIVRLPGLSDGEDIVEFIARRREDGKDDAAIREEINALARQVGYEAAIMSESYGMNGEDDRRAIAITTKEMEVNTQAAMALAEHDAELFQRCGSLVRITEDGDEDGDIKRPPIPRIDIISKETLREKLAAAVAFEKVKTMPDGQTITTPAHPPAWSVAAIHARGRWSKVKRLHAVVNHPILKPDGTILQVGYDKATGIFGKWSFSLDIPHHPTAAPVRTAIKMLDEVIADFEFVDAAHRASWYAALFTPLARFAFEGAVPLFLVDANTRGAGKGLLLDCIASIITGENFAVMPYSNDDEEMRKKITSILLSGERLVQFDNLTGRFGCPALDALVTAPGRWSDRLLGGNKTINLPIVSTFYATGNNVVTQGDMIRRIEPIRLETENEKPEQKTGFRHPNLRAHVRANRPALLSAALTILRAFADAGRPAQTLAPWGSFEAWSDHVRAPVVWAGMPDPAEARDMFQAEADCEADDIGSLLTAWITADPNGDGMTTATAIEKAKSTNEGDLKSAIENLVGNLDPRKLGNRLRRIKRRVIGGLFFEKVGEAQRAVKWAVRSVDRFRK